MTTTTALVGSEETTTTTSPTASTPAADGPRAGRAKRRTFTTEYKRRIVAEYDAAPNGTKGAVLRRERLYDSHVQEWRAAINAGTLDTPPKKGRPRKTTEQSRISELEREVATLSERLETRKLVDRAKGLLMSQLKVTEPDAFRWIQKTAMDRRLSMKEVATLVIDGLPHKG